MDNWTKERRNEYEKKRYYDMRHGKRPFDKAFKRIIDRWVERLYKELVELDNNMYKKITKEGNDEDKEIKEVYIKRS